MSKSTEKGQLITTKLLNFWEINVEALKLCQVAVKKTGKFFVLLETRLKTVNLKANKWCVRNYSSIWDYDEQIEIHYGSRNLGKDGKSVGPEVQNFTLKDCGF